MAGLLRELDDLLRGRKTRMEQLAEGTQQLRLAPFLTTSLLLGALYGACMGLYSVVSRQPAVPMQLLASTVKMPMLFLLTLVVTFPSLYVFSALLGASLRPLGMLRVIVASITVNLAILASLGPITAFFTFTTTSYPFMKLLSVFFLAMSGIIGLSFLVTILRRLDEAAQLPSAEPVLDPEDTPTDDTGDDAAEGEYRATWTGKGPTEWVRHKEDSPGGATARSVFRLWLIIYGLVGVQMGWILRPFIGAPELEFVWFRQRGGNVFMDILKAIGELFGG